MQKIQADIIDQIAIMWRSFALAAVVAMFGQPTFSRISQLHTDLCCSNTSCCLPFRSGNIPGVPGRIAINLLPNSHRALQSRLYCFRDFVPDGRSHHTLDPYQFPSACACCGTNLRVHHLHYCGWSRDLDGARWRHCKLHVLLGCL